MQGRGFLSHVEFIEVNPEGSKEGKVSLSVLCILVRIGGIGLKGLVSSRWANS